MQSDSSYPAPPAAAREARPQAAASAPPSPTQPRFLDVVRSRLRTEHYSRRTEEAYVGWIRRFILSNGRRHPAQMGEPEVTRFLSHLAVERKVSSSTQNQALSALLFLYGEVLKRDLA
jgi:integrase-like protein